MASHATGQAWLRWRKPRWAQPSWVKDEYQPRRPAPGFKMPQFERKHFLIAGAALLLLIAVGIAVATTGSSDDAKAVNVSIGVTLDGADLDPFPAEHTGLLTPASDPAVGNLAPTFTATSIDGTPFAFAHGRPTVFVFVVHSCPHCQNEVPQIVEWEGQNVFPRDVDVVAISSRANKNENNFPPSAWLRREAWPFPAVADSAASQIAQAYGMVSYPYFVAVGANGRVMQRASGELSQADLKSMIDLVAS